MKNDATICRLDPVIEGCFTVYTIPPLVVTDVLPLCLCFTRAQVEVDRTIDH